MTQATTTARAPISASIAAYYNETPDRSFLECRQRLISYLMKLNNALRNDLQDLSHALTSRFCDSLVDYLSAGYFQLFQRAAPRPTDYAAIEATTRSAMAFNDRFGHLREIDVPEVQAALEQLARALSTRFELEDATLDALQG
jgi:regulator of sigma D